MARSHETRSSTYTTSTRDSSGSIDSYGSDSTSASSVYDIPQPSTKQTSTKPSPPSHKVEYQEDLSPITECHPRSSTETYSSAVSSDDEETDDEDSQGAAIPPLPEYRQHIADYNVRPATPEEFAILFPSMNRLSIRHDDFTADGNMNLRVDTTIAGRRRRTLQLYHLRMYDLNKRDFSFRRYSRNGGREVCSTRRVFKDLPAQSRPSLPRSMSSAMKTLTRPQPVRNGSTPAKVVISERPGSPSACSATTDMSVSHNSTQQSARQMSTDSMRLDFHNYARVNLGFRKNKSAEEYDFEWWGHTYAWKRVTDKNTSVVSFHLVRDGQSKTPVAHIVPETRSPNQIVADERSNGWVPPCHMWIADEELVSQMTDVGDVLVITGLMALVDDSIKTRWGAKKEKEEEKKKSSRLNFPLIFKPKTTEFDQSSRPRTLMQQLFNRRHSEGPKPEGERPLVSRAITAY